MGVVPESDQSFDAIRRIEWCFSRKAEACLHNDDTAREILGNRQNGVTQLGIQGTPSFIVHTKDKNELLSGAPTLERLEEIFAQNTVKNKN